MLAGAFQSQQSLVMSEIYPRLTLGSFRFAMLSDLPGVGQSL